MWNIVSFTNINGELKIRFIFLYFYVYYYDYTITLERTKKGDYLTFSIPVRASVE